MCWDCNSYLDGVTIWCENNRMKMNIAKNQVNDINNNTGTDVVLKNKQGHISNDHTCKYLGAHLEGEQTFKYRIQDCLPKSFQVSET